MVFAVGEMVVCGTSVEDDDDDDDDDDKKGTLHALSDLMFCPHGFNISGQAISKHLERYRPVEISSKIVSWDFQLDRKESSLWGAGGNGN